MDFKPDGDQELYTLVDDSDLFKLLFAYVGSGEVESIIGLGLAEACPAPSEEEMQRMCDSWVICLFKGGPADGRRANAKSAAAGDPAWIDLEARGGRIHRYRFDSVSDEKPRDARAEFVFAYAGESVAAGAEAAVGRKAAPLASAAAR